MNWTNEQQAAISLRNKEILVSAAAGSGKTAVMVERILQIIAEGDAKTDIDRLLVVTFTKKAAESMRDKIRVQLEKRLKSDPTNEHLQRQVLLINHAHISTIDSFCSFIVKNYFYLTEDVSSSFRIGEESELKLLEADVLAKLLEEEYKKNSDDFLYFVDYFATGKNDHKIEEIINSLYTYAQSHEDPDKWLKACQSIYLDFENNLSFIEGTIKRIIKDSLREAIEIAQLCLSTALDACGPYMYEATINMDLEILNNLYNEGNLYKLLDLLRTVKFSSLKKCSDKNIDSVLKDFCKDRRDLVKTIVADLKKTFAYTDIDTIISNIEGCAIPVSELIRLTRMYSDKLIKEKKEKNIFSYSDISHIAIEILKDKDNCPSPAKIQLQNLFEEIFIDEYQDSNRLQEELIYLIAREVDGRRKVFMVGDVKQSIYSFRMACPDLFINKLNTFTTVNSDKQKVFLSHNFRSRKQVTDTVNYVFCKLMNESVSDIKYDESQSLRCAADYFSPDGEEYTTEVLHMELADKEINKYEAEAYMIGDRIRTLVDGENGLYIQDKKTNQRRKLEYGDIAIIVRNQKDVAAPIMKVLTEEFSIPVSCVTTKDFFTTYEVNLLISYLRVLDNPLQDIPLTAVLLSSFADLTPTELAELSLLSNGQSLYYILSGSLTEESINLSTKVKIRRFIDTFRILRKRISYTPIHKLIWDIYDLTGFEAFIAAMPAGKSRLDNLKKLINKAVMFESNGYKSLFEFLRYIDRLIEMNINMSEVSTGKLRTDAVTVITMHKSKGLEYPVVFLAGLSKQFNTNDEKLSVLLHQNLGIGLNYVDTNLRTTTKTLYKRLIGRQKHIEKAGEEIRILYVAMTRAQEKLIICCCHNANENIDTADKLYGYDIIKSRSFWGWLRKLIDVNNLLFAEKEYTIDDLAGIVENNRRNKYKKHNSCDEYIIGDELNKLTEQLDFVYESREDDLRKISVTELKESYLSLVEESGIKDSTDLIEKEVEYPTLPKFIQENTGLSPAQRGNVYHSVLEHWNYSCDNDSETIREFLLKMVSEKILTEEEINVIKPEKVQRFLYSDLAKRMKNANAKGLLEREKAFSVILKKNIKDFEILDSDSLLQGIIDAYFIEDDEIVIVDYKTDYVPDNELSKLAQKYEMQLRCYKYALEKILGKKVSQVWIYSIYADKEFKLDL